MNMGTLMKTERSACACRASRKLGESVQREGEREGNTRGERERDSETAVARSLLETMVLARSPRAPQRPPAPKPGDKILIFKEPWLQRNYSAQRIPHNERFMTSYEAFGYRMFPNSKCETATVDACTFRR